MPNPSPKLDPNPGNIDVMSKQALVFEVSDRSFEKYVIANSNKVPVFVTFINIWSEPCAITADMFSALAKEFAEDFIYAKVDVEENEQLKNQYNIKNVPTLVVIIDGKAVVKEEGQLSEDEVRALLKGYGMVNEIEETRLQARQHHMQGDTTQAITLLTQAIQKDPANTMIAMDMVQIFIDIDEIEQATGLFQRLPEAVKNSETGLRLSSQLWVLEQASKTAGLAALNQTLQNKPDDFAARFDCAICEMAIHNTQQGLEHLFYILQRDVDYKDGAVREMIVTIINGIASNNPELAQQYRAKLADMLSV